MPGPGLDLVGDEELAEVTGLSLPQVKTYLHRARQRLRDQLLEWQT